MADAYKETRVFSINNAVIRVHIPDLTAEERSRRIDKIKDAVANMMKGIEKCRKDAESNESKTTV